MKKRLLKVAALLFAACGFVPQAFADSELLNADSRYQKLTQMPAADQLGNYYFILTDKERDLMMTRGAGVNQVREHRTWWYMNSADPTTDLSRVWLIEANTTNNAANGYSFKSVLEPGKYMQTEWNAAYHFRTNDNGGGDASWYQFLFAYDTEGDYWTIQNAKYPDAGYVGTWRPEGVGAGAEVAANKTGDLIGHFTIYAITKQDFALAKIDNVYESVLENSTATDDVRTAYETAIATAKSAIEGAAGDEVAWETALNTLETDRQTYVLAATPNEGATFDMSFLMQDAAVTGTSEAWMNAAYAGPEHLYAGAPDDRFFDIKSDAITQEVSEVRNGVYRLTAATRAQNANGASISLNGVSATVENVGDQGNALCSGWGLTITPEVVVEDGVVTIGFHRASGWANADNFKLEFVRDLNTELAMAKQEALAEIESVYQPVYDNSKVGEARATYGNVLESAKTDINEATAIDEIEVALATLESARQAYVVEGVPNAGYTFDVTFLIADAAVSEMNAPAWTNGRTYDREQYNGAPDNIILDINNEPRDIYQKIDLRPGVYQLKAATRGKEDVSEGYIYINNTKAEIEKLGNQGNELGNGWDWTTTDEVPVSGQAKIGFYANCSGGKWASADDFKLYFVRELTEDDKTTVSLTVTEAGWATLMLPFDAELPSGLDAYTCADTEAGDAEGVSKLVLETATSLEANTPYIIQGAADTYEFKGYSTATQNQYTKGLLTGTYVQMSAVVDSYVLQNPAATGIGFYKVAEVIPTVGAYRAYMNAETADAAGINVSRLILGGDDVTGIESSLAGDGDARVDVYSLSGILVRKGVAKSEALDGLQKGIYVVDGVKKAVK